MTHHSIPIPVRLLGLAVLCCSGWADPARGDEPTWKAGVARAVATPETGVWLAGYGTKRPPDGTLHDLWIKALALEAPGGERVVLVTSDFQGVPKEMTDRVFAELRKKYKLERRQVMITFSHNHCGPRLGSDLVDYYPVEAEQEKLVAEYTSLMEARLVALVGESLGNLAPATLATGRGGRRSPSTAATTARPTSPTCWRRACPSRARSTTTCPS